MFASPCKMLKEVHYILHSYYKSHLTRSMQIATSNHADAYTIEVYQTWMMVQPMPPNGQWILPWNVNMRLLTKKTGTHIDASASTAAKVMIKRLPGWLIFLRNILITNPFPMVPERNTKPYMINDAISLALYGLRRESIT